jgi:glutamyl-tRNA reductase
MVAMRRGRAKRTDGFVMIGLLGLDHQTVSIQARGRLTLGEERLDVALAALAVLPAVHAGAILSTCNRTEVYVATHDWDAARGQVEALLAMVHAEIELTRLATSRSDAPGTPMPIATTFEERLPPEIARALYAEEGADAARHLCGVAAGLRSMVVGEAQILGQVKDALLAAERVGTLDEELRAVFTAALKAGKRVRTETELGRADLSIAGLAMRVAEAALGGLAGKTVLLIGAGRTSQLCGQTARNQGAGRLLFANRTASVAAKVAGEVGGEPLALDDVEQRLHEVDLVISATSAPHAILAAQTVERATARGARPLVILDLAVPPDVEPAAGQVSGVTLHTLDTLRSERALSEAATESQPALARAEQIVEEGVREYVRGQTLRLAVPGIAALRRHVDRSAQAELEQALAQLEHLSAADRAVVSRLGQRLVDKMFHYLVVRVRSLAEYDEVPPQITMQVLARLLADPDVPPSSDG